MKPYLSSIDEVLQAFNTTSQTGLTHAQVAQQLAACGHNELPSGTRKPWWRIFISQFQSPLIYVLVAAAVIIFFVGDDSLDAFIISGVLVFNALVGTIQEGRTANIVESLRRLIQTNSIVIRDGKKMVVNDTQLVPGDIVLLQEGERVPADLRIIESNNIQIDQAVLTGESQPVRKKTDPLTHDTPLLMQDNMAFKGTYVLSGSGKGVVVATGLQTEIGKVHMVLKDIETDVPLRKDVERLSYMILLFVLVTCCGLFITGYLVGKPWHELMVMLTALFICVVPEGLPVVLTLVLVSGVYRMAKQFVLVKNMQAVETLGRTDVIVIDKTGTLTRNEMMVSHVYAYDKLFTVSGSGYHNEGHITHSGHYIADEEFTNQLLLMGTAAALLNSADITYQDELDLFTIKGDPTEAALYIFAHKLDRPLHLLTDGYTKIAEVPFEPAHKYHAGFFKKNGDIYSFVLGAPEIIAQLSRDVPTQAQAELQTLLVQGLRVVAVAHKKVDTTDDLTKLSLEQLKTYVARGGYDYLGFYGIEDSIRADINYVIAQARNAGLRIVMATGDHPETALYVAKRVGIYTTGDQAIDGTHMSALTNEQLAHASHDVTVYSRVTPLDKIRIIDALHAQNDIVAMTGDGINDAPSLVAADLGIAMGRIGTEVAKEAADIILLNDSFISVIHAIEQGRHIFYTLKRVILYFFATNMGEILIILFALLWEIIFSVRLPLPITAAQILWLNLITDGFLDIALSMEPQEQGLLERNWLKLKPKLVDWALVGKMLFFAVPMGLVSLYIFLQYYQANVVHARTMTLITMAMFQWFNAWNCRSNTKSIFQLGVFANKWLVAATAFVLFLQLCILHIPFLQHIFKTVPLSVSDWAVVIGVSLPIVALEELRKAVMRTYQWYNH